MSHHSSDSWLDAQLRGTPLPEGFLEKLRAIARGAGKENGSAPKWDDEALDQLLRSVPLPEELTARIRAALHEEIRQDQALDGRLRALEPPAGFTDRVRAAVAEEALDERLREVPLPRRFMSRVRAAVAEERLHERVREIPIPDGLTARVQATIADEALDERLREVPLPEGLIARVQEAVADEVLDEALRAVEPASSIVARSRVTPYLRPRLHPFVRGVAAAVAFFALSVFYLASLAWIVGSSRPAGRPASDLVAVDLGPLDLEAQPTDVIAPLEIGVAAAPAPRRSPGIDVILADISGPPARGPAGKMAQAFEAGFQPFQSTVMARWQPLGARWAEDNLPNLDTVLDFAAQGVEPPLSPGFDRVFLYMNRVHPRVNPGSDPALASSSVPVSTATASYNHVERLAVEGRLPNPRDVRVEDFLAAVEYGFELPKKPDHVEVRTAAGPSVFGSVIDNLRPQLLQVAAQAGRGGARPTPATHLTVAIDVSASMNWSGRIDITRRALTRLLDHLGPDDRLALVAFNEEIVYLVEDASREDRDHLLQTIQRLYPQGGTNLDAGLRQAVATSLGARLPPKMARRVVLLTDGRVGLPAEEAEKIIPYVEEASLQGLRLDVIDLSRQEEFPRYMEELASAAEGEVRRGESADQIQWSLVEALFGASPVVAVNATLTVTFNPETVAAYRLLGHEPAVMDAPVSTVRGELRNLQAATSLYEVWLKPNSLDDVAVAELTWTDPRSGKTHRQKQRISRLQFAPSLAESPLSLQAAMIAAQTAEVLRESAFVPAASRDLGNILSMAAEVNVHLARRESFRRLASLIERLDELQTLRTP